MKQRRRKWVPVRDARTRCLAECSVAIDRFARHPSVSQFQIHRLLAMLVACHHGGIVTSVTLTTERQAAP